MTGGRSWWRTPIRQQKRRCMLTCMLTERTVFVICLSRVMVVSRVTPKILTVEFAIIVSVSTTKGVFTDTGLLEEWKIINSVFCSLILRELLLIHKQISAMQSFSRDKAVFMSVHCFHIGHIFECRQRSCVSIDGDLSQILTSDRCTWCRIRP